MKQYYLPKNPLGHKSESEDVMVRSNRIDELSGLSFRDKNQEETF